ncbi:MAG: sigma 54-interacting transcriptional regulator [Candidatus Babeliaceae bacterium]
MIDNIFQNPAFLLFGELCALIIKVFVLVKLFVHKKKSILFLPFIFLIFLFLGEFSSDIFWIVDALRLAFFNNFNINLIYFIMRIAWIFYILEFQTLSFFIELLTGRLKLKSIRHIFFSIISLLLISYFFYCAFFKYWMVADNERITELMIMQFTDLYVTGLVAISSFIVLRRLRFYNLPHILNKQLKIFIFYFIVPKILLEILKNNHGWSGNFFKPTFILYDSNYLLVSIVTILSTGALYFCIRKVMGIRFLNTQDHVRAAVRSVFVEHMTEVMRKVITAQHHAQIYLITQQFFYNVFKVSQHTVMIWIDVSYFAQEYFAANVTYVKHKKTLEEVSIAHHPLESKAGAYLFENRIAIRDELEFSHHYTPDEKYQKLIAILEQLNADILVPFYEKYQLVGAIIVERGARKELYSDVERDEMILFTEYINTTLALFKQRRLENIAAQHKILEEHLYQKHQEVEHGKEVLRSFLRYRNEYVIGFASYSLLDKQFMPGNEYAAQLLQVDFAALESNYSAHDALKKLVQQVQQYKKASEVSYKTLEGTEVMIKGFPLNHETISLIIMPIDGIKKVSRMIELLKDPSEWDYVLYLETTQTGKMINELFPGNEPLVFAFKISLLKAVLSKKPLLVQMHQDDVVSTVELIHQLSLRTTLHCVTLTEPEKQQEIALKLYGVHPVVDAQAAPGLLEKLADQGTLFIENIHLLGLETQKILSAFLRTGFFKPVRSQRMIHSSARLICTTPFNVQDLVIQGTFDAELAHLLTPCTLSLPPLLRMSQQESECLMEGYAYQMIKTKGLAPLLGLTEHDKHTIYEKHPASLHELKDAVYKTLQHKTVHKKLEHLVEFDPAGSLTDPDLIYAKGLGKHALKDNQLMILLWNKFQNQTKIAELLGVNRSTVHRRCKELKITAQ